jgi:hypothetical protein
MLIRIAAGGLLATSAVHADDHCGEVFRETCATGHVEQLSAEAADHARDLLTPPMNLLTTIIRRKAGNSEAAFTAHVVEFTLNPDRDRVRAVREALDRFGLMPPITATSPSIDRSDVEAVAHWLFGRYDYETELRELMEHERRERAG